MISLITIHLYSLINLNLIIVIIPLNLDFNVEIKNYLDFIFNFLHLIISYNNFHYQYMNPNFHFIQSQTLLLFH